MHEPGATRLQQDGGGAEDERHVWDDGAMITPYQDGPLILRGRFIITTQDGQPIPTGRRTVALCRCGRSGIKPFCDGSHARTGFRAPDRAPERLPGGRLAAESGYRIGRTAQPLAGVPDSAAQPAGEGQPAAD